MRKILHLSAAPALALVLAACGGGAERAGGPAAEEAAGAATAEAPPVQDGDDAGAAGDAGAADGAVPVPSTPASASVSASATPEPAPAPAAIAVATPPAAFATCRVCHSVSPGQNGVGPSLAGVVGRRAGSVAGANYSPAMQAANLTWTEANLERYLADPTAVVPGTTMPNPGANPAARRAIIDYLKTL